MAKVRRGRSNISSSFFLARLRSSPRGSNVFGGGVVARCASADIAGCLSGGGRISLASSFFMGSSGLFLATPLAKVGATLGSLQCGGRVSQPRPPVGVLIELRRDPSPVEQQRGGEDVKGCTAHQHEQVWLLEATF